MVSIFCPFCGTEHQLDVKPPVTKDVICAFCQSNLKDHINSMNFTAGSPPIPAETPPVNALPQYNDMPDFPRSVLRPGANATAMPFPQANAPAVPAFPQAQKLTTYLELRQFKLKIPIPDGVPEFHFGRNTFFGMVDPNQYDVEWLNSISRVQKDAQGKIAREHFIIHRGSGNKYYIEDRVSRWGTWVNRTQIKGKGKIEIKNGDNIELILFKPNETKAFPFIITFHG
jgi:hypothetical protein